MIKSHFTLHVKLFFKKLAHDFNSFNNAPPKFLGLIGWDNTVLFKILEWKTLGIFFSLKSKWFCEILFLPILKKIISKISKKCNPSRYG